MHNAVFVSRDASRRLRHLRYTCLVRGAGSPLASPASCVGVVPVLYVVLAAQKRHVITCSTEQSSPRGYSARAVGFRTNHFLRANFLVVQFDI